MRCCAGHGWRGGGGGAGRICGAQNNEARARDIAVGVAECFGGGVRQEFEKPFCGRGEVVIGNGDGPVVGSVFGDVEVCWSGSVLVSYGSGWGRTCEQIRFRACDCWVP